MPPVYSSRMDDVSYDADNATMTITFKDGKTYEYYAVPESVYDSQIAAPSPGVFFDSNVKGHYKFRRLT
jgi:hypothetical protein